MLMLEINGRIGKIEKCNKEGEEAGRGGGFNITFDHEALYVHKPDVNGSINAKREGPLIGHIKYNTVLLL